MKLLQAVLPPPAQRAALDYFACGPPAFVKQIATDLSALGVPDHRLNIEEF